MNYDLHCYTTKTSGSSAVRDIFYNHHYITKTKASKNVDEITEKIGMKVNCRSILEVGEIPMEKTVKEYVDETENVIYFDPKDLDI